MLFFVYHKHCQHSCLAHKVDYISTVFVSGENHFFGMQKMFMGKWKGNTAIYISSKTENKKIEFALAHNDQNPDEILL